MLEDKPVYQQQAVEAVERRFTEVLDSRLELFPPDIQSMLRYIHAHLFGETLSVESVKAACNHRYNNITTRFRMLAGVSVREYIANQRLKAAASMLRGTEANVYLIASVVGYTEEAFARLFRKAYGCTPSQYRRRRRERNEQEK